MTALHYLAWSSRSTPQDLVRCTNTDSFSTYRSHLRTTSQFSIKDEEGKSVLHCAVQRGNRNSIEYLIARPDATILSMPDYFGRTLLHYATESSRTDTIDLLRSRGFDIGAIDNNGRMVLHHACQWGNLQAVKHLMYLGVESQLDVVDHDNRTPLQLAELYRSKAVVEYLKELRPDCSTVEHESGRRTAEACSSEKSILEGCARLRGFINILLSVCFALLLVLLSFFGIVSRVGVSGIETAGQTE